MPLQKNPSSSRWLGQNYWKSYVTDPFTPPSSRDPLDPAISALATPLPASASSGTLTNYVSDLPFTVVRNGLGAVERDRSNGTEYNGDGKNITLAGKVYGKGLGVHANSEIIVALNGQYSRFVSDVGVDDEVGFKGTVEFQVWVDGTRLYSSGRMYGFSLTNKIDLNVTGKQQLKLIVTQSDATTTDDHADWADARLIKSNAVDAIKYPLSTRGNQIVDSSGKAVQLATVNWFGMNSLVYVPLGLWANGYKEMIGQMKESGFNTIRLPFSYDALKAPASAVRDAINPYIPSNAEIYGKTPIEVMDAVVKEAGRQGMMVILDNQNFTGDNEISELWYQPGYSEANWINMWQSLAIRYRFQGNVIAADLKNEPHGAATWGSNVQATDWRLAAERAGNAILAFNPNWLIVVEGISADGPVNKNYWWGGNLEGVRTAPVRLSVANRVVYSPHEYGPGLAESLGILPYLGYLNDPAFPNNLESRWTTGFGYIHDQNIAPILVGEFGGPGTTTATADGKWQLKLIEYLDRKNMSWGYWAWNANAYDTGGGLVLDDWKTIRTDRINMLKPILEEATPVPIFN